MKIKRYLKMIMLTVVLLFAFVLVGGPWGPPDRVEGTTQNFSEVVTGVQFVSMPIMGTYTASRTGIVTFTIPFKAKVLGVSAKARSEGGTTPTLTVDVKEDATSILSAPFSVYSTAVTEGTISDSTLADESTISIDLAIGGTSPSYQDITVILPLRRTN